MSIYASIDIGSQTIRLMVARFNERGTLIPLLRDRRIVGLGAGMNDKKVLHDESMKRAVACLRDFAEQARRHEASHIFAAATACVRAAENADLFIRRAQRAAGITISVLSGQQEAALSLKGVQSVIPVDHRTNIVIDIGGGSTEFSLCTGGTLSCSESIPLGVIALAEKHLTTDPPSPENIISLQHEIDTILNNNCRIVHTASGNCRPLLVGTAGTITTLAAIDLNMHTYEPEKINGHILTAKAVNRIFSHMNSVPLKQRSGIRGLEKGRELVIIPGTAIVLNLLSRFSADSLYVSDYGLLEGILLDKYSSIFHM